MNGRDMPVGELLWTPSPDRRSRSGITRFQRWLRRHRALELDDYQALWHWSVTDLPGFWGAVWDHFAVRAARPARTVLADPRMPGAVWFPGAELNYAEHALARDDGHPAVLAAREDGSLSSLSYRELRSLVSAVATGLRGLGVRRGDRVAALLPNGVPAVVGFLATASIGAVWSSCSPDFGERAVEDRFAQIEPTVLLAVDGYRYGGRPFDVTAKVQRLRDRLPGLRATVLVEETGGGALPGAASWAELVGAGGGPLTFEQVPFDHPLWILYSSGTTGLPKGIVHGHGGILLEHLKALSLHNDIGPDEVFFWFTTTGWMMWNYLVSGLLLGATVVCYDGSPTHPDHDALWRLAERSGISCFGSSAPYLMSCARQGLHPGRRHDLSRVRTVGSTGAPLPPEGFHWVYRRVGPDLLLASVSGGTDLCTPFVGSASVLPVHAGEIQCRMLGAKVEAFDDTGHSLVDQVGELVLTAPMPSMPVSLWRDPDGSRLRDSYFAVYPGVWRHGDWVRITDRGSVVVYGRSDSTLNRGGVRMGTSDFYRVVEDLPEITDSLVVDVPRADGGSELLLFVVPSGGRPLDRALVDRLRDVVRSQLSPRHVPDEVIEVSEIPSTLNGKKCEVPVKRILSGVAVTDAVSPGALRNPTALDPFVQLAARRRRAAGGGLSRPAGGGPAAAGPPSR